MLMISLISKNFLLCLLLSSSNLVNCQQNHFSVELKEPIYLTNSDVIEPEEVQKLSKNLIKGMSKDLSKLYFQRMGRNAISFAPQSKRKNLEYEVGYSSIYFLIPIMNRKIYFSNIQLQICDFSKIF